MNLLTLIKLIALTLILAIAGFLVSQNQQGDSAFEEKYLINAFPEKLSTIEVLGANNHVVLTAKLNKEQWFVSDNKGLIDYPAELESLSRFVQSIKQTKLIEAKTTNPKKHHLLGISDINSNASEAALINIKASKPLASFLVGSSAKNGVGQYVRYADDNQVWLTDTEVQLPESAIDWVERSLFDFDQNDILSVSRLGEGGYKVIRNRVNVEGANSEGASAEGESANKVDGSLATFTFEQMPEKSQLEYDTIVDALVRNLTNLTLESIVKIELLTSPSNDEFIIQLADGSKVMMSLISQDGAHYAKLMSMEDDKFANNNTSNDTSNNTSNKTSKAAKSSLWSKWAYKLDQFSYEQLVKNKADYFKKD